MSDQHGGTEVRSQISLDSKRLPEAEQQLQQSLQCEPNLAAYDYLGNVYTEWEIEIEGRELLRPRSQ